MIDNSWVNNAMSRQNLPAEVLSLLAEQRERLAAAQLPDRFGEKVRAALKREIDQPSVFGFRRVMLTAALLALASVLVARKTIDSK